MTGPTNDSHRPTAFVSYAQTSEPWQKIVLQFTTTLRNVGGVDAELDLFHGSDHRQWSTFGPNLIDISDFTLVAVNAAYKRRWEGQEKEGIGAGASREAAAIKAIFERSQSEALRRVKVILLPGSGVDDIPGDLFGFSERFTIPTFDAESLEVLLRSLWGKPAFPKPPLGPIPVLPPRAFAEFQDSGTDQSGSSAPAEPENPNTVDEHDRETLLKRIIELDEALRKQRADVTLASDQSRVVDLESEVGVLKASLEALSEAQKTTRADEPGKVSVPAQLRPLVAALDDNDESVRFEAMTALGDRLDPSLLPRIESLLDDRDPYIRRYAVDYYGRLAGKGATERLVAALDDNDESVRFEAMTALGDRLDPSLLPRIESLLNDRDPYIRRYAVDYYGRLSQ